MILIRSARRGSWDYSSDYYYPNEMNPEILFAEETDQPLSAAEELMRWQFAARLLWKRKCGLQRGLCVEVRAERGKELDGQRRVGLLKKIYPKGTYYINSGRRSSKESPFT